MLTDGRTHGCTDDRQKAITIAHPKHRSGELTRAVSRQHSSPAIGEILRCQGDTSR